MINPHVLLKRYFLNNTENKLDKKIIYIDKVYKYKKTKGIYILNLKNSYLIFPNDKDIIKIPVIIISSDRIEYKKYDKRLHNFSLDNEINVIKDISIYLSDFEIFNFNIFFKYLYLKFII